MKHVRTVPGTKYTINVSCYYHLYFIHLFVQLFFLELTIALTFSPLTQFSTYLCVYEYVPCAILLPEHHLSTPSLPCSVAMWLSSGQKNESQSDVCHFQTWTVRKHPEYYPSSLSPFVSWVEKTPMSYNYIFSCYSITTACTELQ